MRALITGFTKSHSRESGDVRPRRPKKEENQEKRFFASNDVRPSEPHISPGEEERNGRKKELNLNDPNRKSRGKRKKELEIL